MSFVNGLRPPAACTGEAIWFAFQDSRLLVRLESEAAVPPLAASVARLGIEPVRSRYLGTLDGRPCFCAELPPEIDPPPGLRLEPLRQLWNLLPEEVFWVAGRAFQVMDWDRSHQFCGRCGRPTVNKAEERAKLCPGCGSLSYPRICPAIIVAVTRGEEILLARARRFPQALYSVIAGFVDPGESLEECVQREVEEEVGICIRNLRYFASQSWPFPNSLMVGFTAEHAGGEIRVDAREIVDARWFRAEALPRIPDPVSIARRLIDSFVEKQAPR